MAPVQVSAPTFEHHHSGLGVSTPTPRISWRFSSPAAEVFNWKQAAYELHIILAGGSENIHRVNTSDSLLVPWPCEPLESRGWARVRVRSFGTPDAAGEESTDWSPWSTVECALLHRKDWTAHRVTGPEDLITSEPIRPLLFRKSYRLPSDHGEISRARLYSTAFGVYEPSINGRVVGDHCLSPGWTSYKHRHAFQVFDVASFLRPGDTNVIGMEVANGWFAGRLGVNGGSRCHYGNEIGVLAQLEVEFADGHRHTVSSDHTWKTHPSPILTAEIYDGTCYDMNEEVPGWNDLADFDDGKWKPVRTVDFPTAELVSPDAAPIRVTQEVQPVATFASNSGKTIIDFGQNLVGTLRIKDLQLAPRCQVTFLHAEVMENGELGRRPLRLAEAKDTIIASGEILDDWSPKYTYHGFRYVQVDGWDPVPGSLTALVMHTDMVRIGTFDCSHPMVSQLHQNATWSMRGNFLSLPTDCPQRDERMGWTGDIQVFAPSAEFLYGATGMLAGWLQDLAYEQAERNGIPPVTVPSMIEEIFPTVPQAIWCDAAVITPWTLYQYSGDVNILRTQYESMTSWLDKGVRRGPNGLWDEGLWQLGDWLDPQAPPDNPSDARTDSTLVADEYLIHITKIMVKVSALVGSERDMKRYKEEEAHLLKAFRHKYVAPSGLLAGDTQTGLALAIVFDILETEEQRATAAARLVRHVRKAVWRVGTGFAGTPVVTHALSRTGYHQIAYRMLLEKKCPSWMYPITMGATTIWERWDSMLPDGSINPGEMTSFNHYALGSVANWLHEVVGGIRPLEAGWKTFVVQPMPGGPLKHASVGFESPYGRIECSWKLEGGEGFRMFSLSLTVPPNSEAIVKMPAVRDTRLVIAEEHLVGSGIHSFSCSFGVQTWPPRPYVPYIVPDLDGDCA